MPMGYNMTTAEETGWNLMTQNADRFIKAFNEIEQHLRSQIGRDTRHPFPEVVKVAAGINSVVRRYKDELLQYARLRNAIVHELGTNSVFIADPREAACFGIEDLRAKILCPKILRDMLPYAPLRVFDSATSLSQALAYMKEQNFSQVIARSERYVILSCEGVAHWLEAKSLENTVFLSQALMKDVLCFEPEDTYRYLKADDTVERALEVFTNDIGKRVFSILVTEKGNATEKPITIITPWDFVAGTLR
jgi:hypothetical protein